MNVLFVVPHLRKGGPVDVLYNICKDVVENGQINMEILTLRRECKNTKIEDFKELGIPIIQFKFSYFNCEFFTSFITHKIQHIVEKDKIDIVNAHGYHPVIVCANVKKVKRVSTLHNRATEDYINVFGKVVGNYMLRRYFPSLQKLDLNIGVSKSVSDYYQKCIPNVDYVNNGIDVNKFFPVDELEKKNLKKKLGLPIDKKIIVSSGRLEKEKHYEEMIGWFVHSVKDDSVALLILGNGSRWEQCKEVAQGKDNVILPGRVSNVDEYLKCSDFYMSNSESEGMSMAVCEGISCGLYPILSDIPSHRDIGEIVNGSFFIHLADIDVDEILSKPFNPQELHNHVVNQFSIKTMGRGYETIFKKLTNKDY